MDTLENLLKNPHLAAAEQIMLQVGKPVVLMTKQGAMQSLGTPLAAADVERLVEPVIPEANKAAVATQPIQFQSILGGVGYQVRVSKDATGYKAVMQKLAQGGSISTPVVAAAAPPVASPAAPAAAATAAALAPTKKIANKGPIEMDKYFAAQLEQKASDLHMSAMNPPMVRKDGEMIAIPGFPVLAPEDTQRIFWELMPEKNREEFVKTHDTDFAYEYGSEARFRCNVFMDRKGVGAVFRVIPSKILTAEQLNLSKDILKLCFLTKGLVLVTGPTGSGKSTTLCAMIDYINKNRSDHIITIEDPIEFVHENKKCLINQREVHNHTDSFKRALRAALREDPDIILVGEMRDLETIAIAIEMAETGHLVFGTLHTSTAPGTVDRIIDQFPADQQSQIRVMLAESLKGVVAQTLCKKIGGGRQAALEVLLVDHAIANLIREAKTMQIPSSMQTSKGKGNVTLNDALIQFVKNKVVEPQEAYMKAVDKAGFEALLKRENIDVSFITPKELPK